ncbi:MAG: hypothetical protein MI922_06295, partial [Bacteroidales bacterium]|nr:hypothetical protein [Bacteroidales bacterium]
YMKGRPFLGTKRKSPRKYILGSRDRIDESPDLARSITDGQYMYTRVFMPFYPEQKLQKYADVSDIVTIMRQDNKDGNLDKIQARLFNQRPTEYLYDLKSDTWEINNLAGNKRFDKVKKELMDELYNQLIAKRDVLFIPEAELCRIALKDTLFQFRQNAKLYSAKEVIDAAYLVKPGKKQVPRQLELLAHKNGIVRYWGVMGLTTQQSLTQQEYEVIKKYFEKEQVDYVKIALAGICYSREKLSSAKEYLEQSSLSDELFVALQALQTIQNLPIEKIKYFKDILTKVVQKYADNTNGDRYNVHCCAEVTLHLLTNDPLYYEYHEKWLNVKK